MEQRYFNRDLSWLWFNHRVLEEAKDETVPLYERIRFLAIYSSNLEEFYRVRVSYYRNLLRELPSDHPKILEVDPAKVIEQINSLVGRFQEEFSLLFKKRIIPELRNNRIILLKTKDQLTDSQNAYVKKIFSQSVLPTLEPMLLVKKRIKPFLKTGQVYIVFKFFKKGYPFWMQHASYGLVKIPTDHDIPRFIELPEENGNFYIMFLEDLIIRNIHKLFPGYKYLEGYNIKITRDADFEYDDFVGDDLIEVIERIDSTREVGKPNRFQYDYRMPSSLLEFLKVTFNLDKQDLVRGGSIHNFRDFFGLPNPISPRLENSSLSPLRVSELDQAGSLLDEMRKNEYMLHFPFQSYGYFIQFLNEAANSPDVIEIRATQYRVATNSAVVNALISAAENGKKVTVFVELKARFDEEANLKYAQEMKKAGIKIIYSLPGLKVHGKIALVLYKNENGETDGTAFLATGNFNEKTARLYIDHGFFTSDSVIVSELKSLFAYFEDQLRVPVFKEILVPGFNMLKVFKKLFEQEIKNVKDGKPGYILLKMNGLEDPYMIEELYKASEGGVKIDLIVRGVCRLIPDQPFSQNIRVVRIIDRFLEHDRVYLFHNDGEDILYAGSADWMRRNLYRRIECVFPIKNKKLKKEMLHMLKLQLKDTVKARNIDKYMKNKIIPYEGSKPIRSQMAIYEYLRDKEVSKTNGTTK